MYSLKNQRYSNCCCFLCGFVCEMRLKRSFFHNVFVTYCVFHFLLVCFVLRGVVLLFLSLTVYAISALINPNIFPFFCCFDQLFIFYVSVLCVAYNILHLCVLFFFCFLPASLRVTDNSYAFFLPVCCYLVTLLSCL